MARDERMRVTSETEFLDRFRNPVFVSEDWALPRNFTVRADLETGSSVVLDIEVSRESARALRVCVETDSPRGVGSTLLRKVPVRNAMARGCLDHLLRVNRQDDGTVAFMPSDVREQDVPVVKPLVENLIGYERLRAEERGQR